MKNVLFCNSVEKQCGVYQYGQRFYDALEAGGGPHNGKARFDYYYLTPVDEQSLRNACLSLDPVAVIYNWHPDMDGWMKDAPFADLKRKQLLIYHDWQPDTAKYDAILFSDPTMEPHDNWHPVPRPMNPLPPESFDLRDRHDPPWIGVHGFYGAAANNLVERVNQEFDAALVRLHLPFAYYGDRDGAKAMEMAKKCLELAKPGIVLEITHHWMTFSELIQWLNKNDINCYLRDTEAKWLGVSSALDAAISAVRPVAINKCGGFRHAFNFTPSICVEDRSLKEILASGIDPLKPFIAANQQWRLADAVENVIVRLLS